MGLLSVLADLSGVTAELRDCRTELRRIADALDRAVPIPALPQAAPTDLPDLGPSVAESPEEYLARTSREAALAASLGLAPWSPHFQDLILQMKLDLLTNGQAKDEDEAEACIREAFQTAKAEANRR